MDSSSNSGAQRTEAAVTPTRPRKATRRVWMALAAVMALVLLAPTILSMGALRSFVEGQLSERLRGDATVEDVSFGWLTGLEVQGLRVENPPGFSMERPAVTLQSLNADVALGALVFGELDASGELVGLAVHVEQREDGATNLQRLAAAEAPPQVASAAPDAPDEDGAAAERPQFALDVRLRDGAVTIRREGELLETLTDFACAARSASGSDDVQIEASGKLRAGDFAAQLRLDPRAETTDASLVAHGLDLAAWRPLLDSLMPGQWTALSGKVDGEVRAKLHRGDQVEVDGELVVDGPHLAGPVVQGMDLRGDRWTIKPTLALGSAASSTLDASALGVDLEWLKIQGAPASTAGRAALRYDVDVAALAAFGGPIPAMLKGSGAKLAGALDLPSEQLPTDLAGWARVIAADAAFDVTSMNAGGFALRDLGFALDVRDGQLKLTTKPDARVDGGALALDVDVDLSDFGALPARAAIVWTGGKLTGGATQQLRYLAPMLAGLDRELADIVGRVDLELRVAGPAQRGEQQTWLEWADAWSGEGALRLNATTFSPARSLAGLLQPLGTWSAELAPIAQGGKLKIDALSAPFSLTRGALSTAGATWLASGKEIGLVGSVGLDGVIDYALDLTPLLRGHRDGERVLAAFDSALPGATLSGTVDDPQLGLPKLGDIATKALKDKGRELLEGGIQKGLDRLFGGRKKRKRD
ncbi:MAG: hypothetical protein VXY92_12995 [Planctomycetota bacterium]|nr:hypothetical protein [Planctomycetota bacterium]